MNTDADGSVFGNLKDVTGCRYNRSQYNKDIIKTYLLREAQKRGIRLPSGTEPERFTYFGAHVEVPVAGLNENVVYVDLSSLYPSAILTLNASPETLIGTQEELEESTYDESDCLWSYIDTRPVKHLDEDEQWRDFTDGQYKIIYDPSQQTIKWRDDPRYERCYYVGHDIQEGFLASCVEDLVAMKDQYRGSSLYGAIKRVVNSVYGVVSYSTSSGAFPLYNWRLAESITLLGRKVIQHTRDDILASVAANGFEDGYTSHGDTDGIGICLPHASTRHEAMSVVRDAVESLNEGGYAEFARETFNVAPENQHLHLDIESYAPRVFIPAVDPQDPSSDEGVRKRYGQWVTIEDGEEVDEIDITGLEHERSDVAPITKEAQSVFFEHVLRDGPVTAKEAVYPRLRDMAQSVRAGDVQLSRVAKRGGIGQPLSEYGTPSRRPQPLYRGAKYADRHLDVTVSEGDKPQLVYVDGVGGDYPSTYTADTAEDGTPVDAVALPDPAQLPEEFHIDWERHWQKCLKSPMEPLLQTLGWSWTEIKCGHEQTTLSEL